MDGYQSGDQMNPPFEQYESSPQWMMDRKYFYYTRYNTSNQHVDIISRAMTYGLIPAISIFGMGGNIMTICVLKGQGIKKSHDIFVLALAIADMLYLLGVNNISRILYDRNGHIGFNYSKEQSKVLFAIYIAQNGMEINGKFINMIIPAFISLERFIAVFFPLRLKSLVTARRAKMAVIVVFVSWIPANIYFILMIRLAYIRDTVNNTNVGYIIRTDLMINHPDIYRTIAGFFFVMSGPLPVAFVFILCLAIGIKISILTKKRKHIILYDNHQLSNQTGIKCENIRGKKNKLEHKNVHFIERVPIEHDADKREKINNDTEQKEDKNLHRLPHNKVRQSLVDTTRKIETIPELNDSKHGNREKYSTMTRAGVVIPRHQMSIKQQDAGPRQTRSVSQTTMMLLSMCIVYSVIGICSNIPNIIFNRDSWESDTGAVVELLSQLAVSINSSCNFVIYLATNRHFRISLRHLLCQSWTRT